MADKYRINWLVDNLPAASKWYTVPESEDEVDPEQPVKLVPHYDKGFDLGFVGSADVPNSEPDVKYIYNHVHLIIYYHDDPANYKGSRIVGFEVDPYSIKHKMEKGDPSDTNKPKTCDFTRREGATQTEYEPQRVSDIKKAEDKTIIWTYDVTWRVSLVATLTLTDVMCDIDFRGLFGLMMMIR